MKTKLIRNITLASVLIALLGGVGFSAPANAAEITRYITLSATGTAIVVPDAVRVTATVSVLAPSSKTALATAGTTSKAIREALTANKIAARDVATQSISVFPEYSYPINMTPVLSGYRATQSFSITVRAATTAGAVVDAIVNAGGDNVQLNGASPFVLNNDRAIETARENAVKRAKAKAVSYAKLLGVKLGRVVYLNEDSAPSGYPVYGMATKAEDSATEIDLGEQKVTVSVTVRWAL
jgi:uncharacterized protein YggE